ncbi:hypothetical protein HL658_30540 [Azospirillum sp. RWY-5-1]|uniref:Anti-sigma factor n=1 Tax=Azospirillum oleiclasticum TaxID=2735135 RepID=A0ABX2TC16_9PROT|nr:hypothetical protein [Azospirillum oleiclasticum]NYZ16903.1 hypothetical protein [Azospirillum oleiclasticum]NYZ21840.1 hypothetical protein [Azospirillum oleiclasticum]
MTATIDEHDLLAYVDEQLDPQRRIEVERYLARHPALAARVMRDLQQRHEIGLALGIDAPARRGAGQRTAAAGRGALARILTGALLLAVGWGAHGWVGGATPDPAPLPVFADEAMDAHRAFADHGPSGGGDAPRLSQAAGAQATAPIPAFPKRLFRLGVRIVPWDEGSAAQVIFATPEGERVTLFAAELPDSATSPPQTATVGGVSIVHWRIGPHAYALCGRVPTGDLLEMAEGARPEEPSL